MDVIITGASGGIGYETALRFAEDRGNRVFVLARREEELSDLAGRSVHNNIIPYPVDLSKCEFEGVISFLKANKCSHVDVLVHNAGHLVNASLEKLTLTDWESVYRVNVFSVAFLTRALLSDLLGGDKHSHIVMIGSIGGIAGTSKFPGLTAYSSSKGALAILGEVMSAEFASKNVAVNTLALGSVQTEMLSKAFPVYRAKMDAKSVSEFIYEFGMNGWKYFNGKTLPVSISNP